MKKVIAIAIALALTGTAHAWYNNGGGTRNSGNGYTYGSDGYKREMDARRQDQRDYDTRRSQQYGSGRRHSEGSRYQGLQSTLGGW